MARNLIDEMDRMVSDGSWELIFAPHYGRNVNEVAGEIAYKIVVGAYERRARGHRLTGEFIVYEQRSDDSNYYLTLGSHDEYDAIRDRVEAYKQYDRDQDW